MKSIYLSLFLHWLYILSWSQDSTFHIFDTLALEEVRIVEVVPLNDASIRSIYQSSDFSSIDKVNSLLGGVSLISRGAYAMEPSLNGFSGGQINVSIAGMHMFGACTDKMDPITSYVELVNLRSLEIYHGSNGSITGSTIGGSYNMELESPNLNLFTTKAGTAYETAANAKQVLYTLNYGADRWAYRLSGIYKDYQEYKDGNGQVVNFSQFRKYNLHQSLLLKTGKTSGLTFDFLLDDANNVGYPALPMDVGTAEARMYSLEFSERNRLWILDNFKTRLYVNTVYHLMDDSERDSIYFLERPDGNFDTVYMKMDMPGWSNTYGAYLSGNISWLHNNILTFKLEDYYNWTKAEMTMYMNNLTYPGEPPMYAETWPENERNVSGFYLGNSSRISSKLNIAMNMRIDFAYSKLLSEQGIRQFEILGYDTHNSYNKVVKSFNLNLNYKILKQFNLETGFGYGERLPSLSEQFGFYLFNAYDGYDYIGNPDIGLEKAQNIHLNLEAASSNLKITWENYFNYLSDYIFGVTKTEYEALNLYASGVKQYENLKNARLFSSNLKFYWKVSKNIHFFNLSKYNFGDLNKIDPMPLIAPFMNNITATFNAKMFLFQFENEFSARQNRINTSFGEFSTESYTLFNLRFEYTYNQKKTGLKFGLALENIFNEAYSAHLDWGDYNRPGRNLILNLTIDFKNDSN